MRTQNKKILFLLGMSVFILVGLFSFSTAAFAEIKYTPLAPIDGYVQTMNITPTSFSDYLNNMFKLGIALCTALAVLMIIVGGIQYVSSDAWSKKSDGKERIFAALFGLLIAFGSWALLNTIDPMLLSTELTLQKVTIEGIPDVERGQYTGNYDAGSPTYNPYLEGETPGVGPVPSEPYGSWTEQGADNWLNRLSNGTRGTDGRLVVSTYSSTGDSTPDSGTVARRGNKDNLLREGSVAFSPDLINKYKPKTGAEVFVNGVSVGFYEDATASSYKGTPIRNTVDIYDENKTVGSKLKNIPPDQWEITFGNPRTQITNPSK